MRALKAAVLYFALVFSAGVVLGAIRTLWVVPRLSARTAGLMEMPLMTGVSAIAARFVVRRISISPRVRERLVFGFLALALMLSAEFTLVLRLRGLSFRDYVTHLDPVSGTAYYAALLLFAFMPAMVARGRD